MFKSVFSKGIFVLPILLLLLVVYAMNRSWANPPSSSTSHNIVLTNFAQQTPVPTVQAVQAKRLLHGKTASLSWISGGDCQQGIQAYLQTASTNPDAALVGTAWVNPLNGSLIIGPANKCVPGSLSMDSVIQLVHSKGGMAYLTVTMDTEDPNAWTPQQQSIYIDKAASDESYIEPIVHEAMRGGYDGVIMDLEHADYAYPSIQKLFASYNQKVWAALQPLHKLYGIALVHKISERDDSYKFNGFQNWSLLAHAADFIVIMSLDQSYLQPGPAVSTTWLNSILAYALQTLPSMLPNVIWELPLYGDSWHWDQGKWFFDQGVTYQDAQTIVAQLAPSQIDAGASDLQSVNTQHVVYTDSYGVKHALWYLTPKGLYNTIVSLQKALQQEPQFGNNHVQLAFWWRTTLEPRDFWSLLDSLY